MAKVRKIRELFCLILQNLLTFCKKGFTFFRCKLTFNTLFIILNGECWRIIKYKK